MTWTVEKYVKALWDMRMPLEQIEKACEIYDSEPMLKEIFENPAVYREEKERIIAEIFPREVHNLMKMLCAYLDIKYFHEIVEGYRRYANQQTGVVNATLRYVKAPNETQLAGIRDFLKKEFDAEDVELQMEEDKTLMGGFVLEAEGKSFDWSLKGRYALLRNKIL